jgi:hypothetical protein
VRQNTRGIPGLHGAPAALLAVLAAAAVLAQPPASRRKGPAGPLRSVREVDLFADAAKSRPVELDAVVTYSDPEWGLLFVQDSTGGIFVDMHGKNLNLEAGTRVTVRSVTAAGDLGGGGILVRPAVRVRGEGPLPEADQRPIADLEAGASESRWVRTIGVLHPCSAPWNRTCFTLVDGKSSLLVVLPHWDRSAERLVGAKVRIAGVAASRLDSARKRAGAQIFTPRSDYIQALEDPPPADPFAAPIVPIASLHFAGGGFVRRFHVRGTVGTGLGLAICSKLVGLMGGSIDVESQPGSGSVFRFEVQLDAPLSSVQDPRFDAADLRGRKVLVAIGNATNRESLARMLADCGLEAVQAGDGAVALEAAAQARSAGDPFIACLLDRARHGR